MTDKSEVTRLVAAMSNQEERHAIAIRDQAARIAELEAALKKVQRICENRQPDKLSDAAHIARKALAKDTSHDG